MEDSALITHQVQKFTRIICDLQAQVNPSQLNTCLVVRRGINIVCTKAHETMEDNIILC
jgi:hypothetical protein